MCREPGFARRQKKNCLSVSSLLMIPFTDCFFNSVRHCNVFSFPTRPRIQDSLASLARRMRVACRINQLSGRRQKRRFQTGCRSRRSSDLPDFEDAFLCIAVEVGLEKRLRAAKSLVSATFFTERERPTEIVMHKRRTVFSRL